ncbi:MAG: hypothetical protein UU98_C0007G0031 [Parcubacteria group bacterium GW2011_GWD2_42_14]|nr:MAG: hypothetical protein UU98_C0007G0031 [Parcubacteria group bacterium GW2011_GWD2_42_14]
MQIFRDSVTFTRHGGQARKLGTTVLIALYSFVWYYRCPGITYTIMNPVRDEKA